MGQGMAADTGPIVRIRSQGNVGNRMLQYMAALELVGRLRRRVGHATLANVELPEWGIRWPDAGRDVPPEQTLSPHDHEMISFDGLVDVVAQGRASKIDFPGYLQRMEFYRKVAFYRALFASREIVDAPLRDDDLVISVRSGELLRGLHQYPLVPIEFYEDLVSRTGLTPVLAGQIGDNSYCDLLRRAFPKAPVYRQLTPMGDFELLRRAKNVVVSTSTFSFLGAWLSEARQIFLPLHGFFNPARYRETDLVPSDDPRFRFFLFPLVNGVVEARAYDLNRRIRPLWREITREEAGRLRTHRPTKPRLDWGSYGVDETWYLHRYLDAATTIAHGDYDDPAHHYHEVGRGAGYFPAPPGPSDLPNAALGKRATLSSASVWGGDADPTVQASRAVDGRLAEEFAFHTEQEDHPWWMVDLRTEHDVGAIVIFNRRSGLEVIRRRALPLLIQVALHDDIWRLLHVVDADFRGADGAPFRLDVRPTIRARKIRLMVGRRDFLHLSQVQVFGTPAGGAPGSAGG